MSNSFFSFKQFTVHQNHSAMKVGTDGCLLGAWARGGERILDVGCGTGLISLMMAQRYPDALVHAIDIEEGALADAKKNIIESPFGNRVTCEKVSFQDFDSQEPYDAIVTNPPYYDDSLKNPDALKAVARHSDSLPFRLLAEKAYSLLANDGALSVVLPTESLKLFTAEAAIAGFILVKHVSVKTVGRKSARRHLLEFRKQYELETIHEEQLLQDADGNRSTWFAQLLRDFYL